jgi:hypothetical protein
VVDAPDDPAAVRAGLEPAVPRVPEARGRAREKHDGHDRFDLSHAPPPEPPRRCLRHPYYPDADGRRGRRLELPAELLPSVEESQEKLERLKADQGGRLTPRRRDEPRHLGKVFKGAAGPSTGGSGSSLGFYLEISRTTGEASHREAAASKVGLEEKGRGFGTRSRVRMAGSEPLTWRGRRRYCS